MANNPSPVARRDFLKFLAASPTVAAGGGVAAFLADSGFAQDIKQSGFASIMRDRMSVVDKPADALTVFDENAALLWAPPVIWQALQANGVAGKNPQKIPKYPGGPDSVPERVRPQARIGCTTSPCTSVRRKSRPWKR